MTHKIFTGNSINLFITSSYPTLLTYPGIPLIECFDVDELDLVVGSGHDSVVFTPHYQLYIIAQAKFLIPGRSNIRQGYKKKVLYVILHIFFLQSSCIKRHVSMLQILVKRNQVPKLLLFVCHTFRSQASFLKSSIGFML